MSEMKIVRSQPRAALVLMAVARKAEGWRNVGARGQDVGMNESRQRDGRNAWCICPCVPQ